MNIRRTTIILTVLTVMSMTLYGQVVLTDAKPLPPSDISECISITIDKPLTVINSTNCNAPISLIFDSGNTISGIGVIKETTTTFPHTFTLDELGLYSFICENKYIADQCFNVIPVPTPTIGEWGLIILGLIMSIIAVVSIQSRSELKINSAS